MSAVTRESFLAKRPPKVEMVQVPDYGDVYIRVMSGTERDHYEWQVWRGENASEANIRAKLLVKCICDEKGERLFRDEDVSKLGEVEAPVLVKLNIDALRINKMRTSDIEDLVKNSDSAASGATI